MWLKLVSWGAGHWLPLAVLFLFVAVFMAGWGFGRDRANTAWEARIAARDAEDAEAAAQAGERYATVLQDQIVKAARAERLNADYEARNAVLAGSVASLNDRLRYYARRASAVPPATNCPAPVDAPTGPAFDAGRAAEALGDFAAEWGRIRDAEAGRLNAVQSMFADK